MRQLRAMIALFVLQNASDAQRRQPSYAVVGLEKQLKDLHLDMMSKQNDSVFYF